MDNIDYGKMRLYAQMNIYCCECKAEIKARLTDGKEIYPHRKDLYKLPFWICDQCKGYVGTHHKTKQRTKPLGVLANKAIKNARIHIHALIDPAYKSELISRKSLYKQLSDALGYDYHTGEIRTVEQAREVYKTAKYIIENAKQANNDLDTGLDDE